MEACGERLNGRDIPVGVYLPAEDDDLVWPQRRSQSRQQIERRSTTGSSVLDVAAVERAIGQMHGLGEAVALEGARKQRQGLALEPLGLSEVAKPVVRQGCLGENLSRTAEGQPCRSIGSRAIEGCLSQRKPPARSTSLALARVAKRHAAVEERAQPRGSSRASGLQGAACRAEVFRC